MNIRGNILESIILDVELGISICFYCSISFFFLFSFGF